jgi:hypothetical protein
MTNLTENVRFGFDAGCCRIQIKNFMVVSDSIQDTVELLNTDQKLYRTAVSTGYDLVY